MTVHRYVPLLALCAACGRPAPADLTDRDRTALSAAVDALGKGDYAAALEATEALARRVSSAHVHYVRGLALQRSGRAARAVEELDKAQRLDPANADVAVARVRACLAAGRTAEAAKAKLLAKAAVVDEDVWTIAVEVGGSGAGALASSLVDAGKVYLGKRRYGVALGLFQEAAVMTPGDAGTLTLLGSALSHLNRWAPAVAALRKATEADPGAVGAWKLLGLGLTELGRQAEAMEAYRKVLELHPGDPDALSALGRAPPPRAEGAVDGPGAGADVGAGSP